MANGDGWVPMPLNILTTNQLKADHLQVVNDYSFIRIGVPERNRYTVKLPGRDSRIKQNCFGLSSIHHPVYPNHVGTNYGLSLVKFEYKLGHLPKIPFLLSRSEY